MATGEKRGALMQSDVDAENGVVSTSAFNQALAPVSKETVESIVSGDYGGNTEEGN